ncbi:hypothetical protein ANN_09828 [Periplaneta americana]|uniref:Mos1 transposase HTH domain-containing protein n=1 Tax=Periplaneta americana TaxID=6978 RepID=A0ABQ8TMG6_PERAM|nr:hypothetical protein ANN_09828 [Periplaneta americana]
MAGLCEGGNEPAGSLKTIGKARGNETQSTIGAVARYGARGKEDYWMARSGESRGNIWKQIVVAVQKLRDAEHSRRSCFGGKDWARHENQGEPYGALIDGVALCQQRQLFTRHSRKYRNSWQRGIVARENGVEVVYLDRQIILHITYSIGNSLPPGSLHTERIPNLTGEQSDGITVFRIPPMTSLMLHRCRTGAINLQRWWQSPSAAISESDWFLSRLVPVAWQQWSEMEALIPSPAAYEVRSVIKFLNAQSIAPIEIHRQLCQIYGPNIMSKQMVRRWCWQFSEGRQSVHDEERSGRPSHINDDHVEVVRQCIMENRRFTITELSSHFPQISRSLLHEIVTKHLLFKKVCARRVPENLSSEPKMQRLGAALTFLQRYRDDGDEFLDRIVTGDETWISHFTPETKQQSMHWRHSGSPVRTKFKHAVGTESDVHVNADRYCETLRKLRLAIQNKRRGMLTAGVVLLHDNARPHTARRTAAVLTEFGWELFHHLPYSPDLVPSDFHVFLHLKKFLSSGERFGNDEELKTSVTRWFHRRQSSTTEGYKS